MNATMKLRWIVVCCIWGLALVLTLWNSLRIDGVAEVREKSEQIRKEISFQRQNAQALNRILTSHDALFLQAESVDLGMVAVRSRLQAMAAAFDLKYLNIQAESSRITEEQVPCGLSMQGALSNTINFLTALQKYQYLKVIRADVKTVRATDEVEVEIELLVQYKIVSPDTPMERAPELLSHAPATAARPL